MRIVLFTSLILLFSCTQNKNDKEEIPRENQSVLTAKFSDCENFFLLETLDLRDRGINDEIHVIYVSFDPSVHDEKVFPGKDNIDEFSFKITENGKYQPMFNKAALSIGKDFKSFFVDDLNKHERAKVENSISHWIEMKDKPEWWQYDQTPLNSKGNPMTFICQVDMGRIITDDCRLFVFYDKEDRIVKNIYQRD